ncbi:alpha/beta-hydrolase [Triangularia verruculosa]|uniref:Alpha/beta-hydrolase n=1 Tax=Triangularia verruculosa TaxID=2587418 RepID=A0AAN6XRJ5_9PEZI|nr:alpha/beta-hydrolase [Triangularia verruculosa]
MSLSLYTLDPPLGSPHTHTIILLHGRDSDAVEFASEFFESEATSSETANRTLPALLPTVRWVFPQAKPLHSERFDIVMPQWFDMWSLDDVQQRRELQAPGLLSSVDLIIQTIKNEELLVPRNRIFLGGISQGFATSLAALFADGKGGFAGLVGFCSWFPLADDATDAIRQHPDSTQRLTNLQRLYISSNDNDKDGNILPAPSSQLTSTRILLEHSRDDTVISIENGTRMRDTLKEVGFPVEWCEYDDGGHWINEPQGVDDFVGFVRKEIGRRLNLESCMR